MEELMLVEDPAYFGLENPFDDFYANGEDEELDDYMPRAKTRRNPTSNPPDPMGIGSMLLLASVGYLIWCGIKYSQTKIWSWTPWKTVPVSRRLTPPKTAAEALPVTTPPGFERITLIVP